MGSEELGEKLRNAAIRCLKVTMPNLSEVISNTDYFASTIGIGNKKEQFEEGFETADKVYVLVDFTSRQKDHIDDRGPHCQKMYLRLMRAQNPLS